MQTDQAHNSGQRICMIRADLEGIPDYPLPAGYAIRPYVPGDERHWLAIHRAADVWLTHTPETFGQQFGHDAGVLAQRQLYLVAPDGQTVGTTTAWFDNDFHGERWGRIHWVAIAPPHQGRGLGKPLLAAGCRRLKERGHDRACLGTNTCRVPAVNLYLRLGFRPFLATPDDRAAWLALAPRLHEPLDLPS